jgi:tRNA threonylcarbamoyladenosine biosynthesis protein TsaE
MTVLLCGDPGAGKTVLVRGAGEALGVERVRSPSFTLVNEYRTKTLELAHVDLYRLDPEGIEDLDLEEYLFNGCVLLVEWAERWTDHPREALRIGITVNGTERTFVFSSFGAKAGRALDKCSTLAGCGL